jgi:HSP20 family molecular chaperone IbpA
MSSNTTSKTNTNNNNTGKNNKKKFHKRENSDKPRLTFKELLFELNNLKKHQHSPKVDLHERDNNYVIRMELPGLSDEDVNVQLRDSQFLLISGNKQNLTYQSNDNVIYSECHYGNFMRRVKVPASVNKNSIKKHMSNGVLVLTVEKLPQVKEEFDSRLDDEEEGVMGLKTLPGEAVIDFNTLKSGTGNWADESCDWDKQ